MERPKTGKNPCKLLRLRSTVLFIHQARKIQGAYKILNLIGTVSNEDVLRGLQILDVSSHFTSEDGNTILNGGALDHAKFIAGEKSMYNKFISELIDASSLEEECRAKYN